MVGNPDRSRTYLVIYLYKLASLCKDAKISFSMLVESTNALGQRPPTLSPQEISDFNTKRLRYENTRKLNSSVNRIALLSLVLISGDISKLIWPHTDIKNYKKKQLRQKRKQHLEKFFPSENYPNLKNKNFRNFLEHSDDEMDSWSESTNYGNIAINTMGFSRSVGNGTITGNITLWNDFDPKSFTITYYDEKKGSETTNLNDMHQEIIKLQNQIPRALVEINDSPPNFYDFVIDE